jgi:hypothetical protein
MNKSPNDTSITILMKEKMMISRDVEFNKEGAWDRKVNNGEKFDFLPILDEEEERYKDHPEYIIIPPQTPMSLTSSSSSESSSSDTSPSPPRRMRSLDDLYEVIILLMM